MTTNLELALVVVQYAWDSNCNVLIAGDARVSQTTAAETAAAMWPGRMRLVTVPPRGALRS